MGGRLLGYTKRAGGRRSRWCRGGLGRCWNLLPGSIAHRSFILRPGIAIVVGNSSEIFGSAIHASSSNNLIQGIGGSSDPLFVVPIDPADAPTTSGDLRLQAGSPAIDAGLDSANTSTTDLGGNPRKVGNIDLGAYKSIADTDGDGLTDAFEEANTNPSSPIALDPTDDQDGDGMTAIEEFAYGLSDLVPNQTGDPLGGVHDHNGILYQCIHYRRHWDALPFLTILCERSTDLGIIDNWSTGETSMVAETRDIQNPNVDDVIERSLTDMASQVREFLQIRVSKR